MTEEMMSLKGLIEKASDADILREMISFAAERLMELEVGALTGALRGEKRRPPGAAQWLSRPDMGDARRQCRIAYPQAADRQLFPWLS